MDNELPRKFPHMKMRCFAWERISLHKNDGVGGDGRVLGCGGNFNGNISGVSLGFESCSPVIKSSLANIWFNVSILQFKLLNIQIWLTAAAEISIPTPLLSPIQFGISWEKFNFRSDKTFNWNFLNKITNLAVLFNKSFSIDWLIEVYLDMYTVNTIDLSVAGNKFMREIMFPFLCELFKLLMFKYLKILHVMHSSSGSLRSEIKL